MASAMKNKAGRPKGSGGGSAPRLSDAEVKRLIQFANGGSNGTRNVALLHFLLSGCRVSEPLSLKVRDILNAKGEVADNFILQSNVAKNGKTRRIFLSKQAIAALGALCDDIRATSPVKPDEEMLFPIASNYATTLVKQLLVGAGISATSHSLRRTAASKLQENGVAPRHIQEVLGHSSLATTQIYLDKNPALVANAVSTLEW
jgi:integrase/recombinase XerD